MYSNNMASSAYSSELAFRQSSVKLPSERTAQVSRIEMPINHGWQAEKDKALLR